MKTKTIAKFAVLALVSLSFTACETSQTTSQSPLRVVNPGSRSILVYR